MKNKKIKKKNQYPLLLLFLPYSQELYFSAKNYSLQTRYSSNKEETNLLLP